MRTYGFIRAEEANHSIRTMCRVLGVSRSAYYEWREGETHQARKGEIELAVRVKAVFRRHRGRYGAPRVTEQLRREGLPVNRKRVARVMREHELAGCPRRVFRGGTTDSNHSDPVAPNLLERNFTVDAPNKALVGDITYLPTHAGWVYLAVLIDLFSRKVVGWAMSDTIHASLCLTALTRVVATRGDLRGAIHHTDRGSQYASRAYRSAVAEAGMRQSMSRKGDCWDNAVAESFFGTLEQELVSEASWRDMSEARRDISAYIHNYYNCERLHSTLGYFTPQAFEAKYNRPAPEAVAA